MYRFQADYSGAGGTLCQKNAKRNDDRRWAAPVGDNQNSLTVGPRGPVVFEDFLLFEKMAHFNREAHS